MDEFSRDESSSCPQFEQNWIETHKFWLDEFAINGCLRGKSKILYNLMLDNCLIKTYKIFCKHQRMTKRESSPSGRDLGSLWIALMISSLFTVFLTCYLQEFLRNWPLYRSLLLCVEYFSEFRLFSIIVSVFGRPSTKQ